VNGARGRGRISVESRLFVYTPVFDLVESASTGFIFTVFTYFEASEEYIPKEYTRARKRFSQVVLSEL